MCAFRVETHSGYTSIICFLPTLLTPDRIISTTVEKATCIMHTLVGFIERLTNLANPILEKLQDIQGHSVGQGEALRAAVDETSGPFNFSIGDMRGYE